MRLEPRARRRAAAGRAAATAEHAEDAQHDHRPDDRADDDAEIELVLVSDPEQVVEQEEAHEPADDPDPAGGHEAHRVVARKQRAPEVSGDDADHDGGDDLSEHVWGPFLGWRGPAG